MSTPTVALLGLGTMGQGMAGTILRAGLPLRVWNRGPAKAQPYGERGAHVAADPADAVAGADLVVTMLFDLASVADVMGQAARGISADAVWVQMSTVGVEGADRLAGVAAGHGLAYVDAPVLGTKKPAVDGTLVVLASGAEDLRDRCTPLFDAVGAKTLWVGPAGAGSRLKVVANAWVLAVLEGIAESITLAEGLGLDPRLFLEAIAGGSLDAPYVGLKGRAMIEGNFAPSFSVAGAAKDAGLILAAAEAAGTEMPITGAAERYLREVAAAGYGSDDMAAIIRTRRG